MFWWSSKFLNVRAQHFAQALIRKPIQRNRLSLKLYVFQAPEGEGSQTYTSTGENSGIEYVHQIPNPKYVNKIPNPKYVNKIPAPEYVNQIPAPEYANA